VPRTAKLAEAGGDTSPPEKFNNYLPIPEIILIIVPNVSPFTCTMQMPLLALRGI
jgi:hypothetical protein